MKGTKPIEWVGAKSVFADPVYQYRRTSGLMTEVELEMYRKSAEKRVYRVDGQSIRVLGDVNPRTGLKDPPLSKEYRWGPQAGSYVQRVRDEDWDLIRVSRSAAEFRDVTNGIPEEPMVMVPEIVTVQEDHFDSLKAYIAAERNGGR